MSCAGVVECRNTKHILMNKQYVYREQKRTSCRRSINIISSCPLVTLDAGFLYSWLHRMWFSLEGVDSESVNIRNVASAGVQSANMRIPNRNDQRSTQCTHAHTKIPCKLHHSHWPWLSVVAGSQWISSRHRQIPSNRKPYAVDCEKSI